MEITTKTILELKALAYDEFAKLQACENNLKIINSEISKRIKEEVVTDETKS